MKRLLAVAALLATLTITASAASWDGVKGPLSILTFTFASGAGSVPGVPIGSGPTVWHTTMFIRTFDLDVSAVRVRIVYRDSSGEHVVNLLADLFAGYGGVTLPIATDAIIEPPQFTELRDGQTH